MEITYAVIIRKEYQNIITTLDEMKYEVIDVFDTYDLAENALRNTEGELLSNLNKIDTNGYLKTYQAKILPLEGKYDVNQVQSILNALKDKAFKSNSKVL